MQGLKGDDVSDIFSLGVVAYEMLTGALPYGRHELTPRRLHRLRYLSATRVCPDVPQWIGLTLEKATAIDRRRRYVVLSEFLHDLSHPNPAFVAKNAGPLIGRNPLLVWKMIAPGLFLVNVFLSYRRYGS